ncbi:MAG: glycosyltransferase family 2 protein [Planctomycetes bacterium]|nr:glycosyltransferase family 2 protein [Planctomycetota bacterium]
MQDVAVVIPSWNTRELLAECLRSLEASTPPPREIVVIDNASRDGSAVAVRREFPRVALLENRENLGYTRACNQGLAASRAKYVLLLNADARLERDTLAKLVDFLEREPAYGAVAPRLENPDGSLQRSIMRLPGWRTPLFFATPFERWFPKNSELARYFAVDFDYDRDADVEQPAAACLLVRRATLDKLAGLDERLWLFYSDVDLAARIRSSGERIRYLASARATHHLGRSTRQYADFLSRWHADRLLYYRAHHGRLAAAWVKACVLFAYGDFVARQTFASLFRRPHEPVHPVTRALLAFLAR